MRLLGTRLASRFVVASSLSKMKHFIPISCLALLTTAALSGCGTSPAAENSVAPAIDASANGASANGAVADSAISSATPASAATPTGTPMGTPTGEDERYRATNVDDAPFAPTDKPADIALYKKYMKVVKQLRPPLAMKVPDKARVVLQTNRGPITLELDGKAAPLQVKSFLYLAGKGFYDGTMFHRHADLTDDGKGFIIQGGDPLTKYPDAAPMYGRGGPSYETPREPNKLTHEKLIIAAARTQNIDSAGSQFYITQGAVPFLDEGDGYTVFGKVVAGQSSALKLTMGDKLKSVKVEKTPAKK